MPEVHRVIVAGGRDFTDRARLFSTLDATFSRWPLGSIVILSGGARGADQLGEAWARERGVTLEVYPALWDVHGRAAGPIRNRLMVDGVAEPASHMVAFWDGRSRGTQDCISYAQGKGLVVKVVRYPPKDSSQTC